MNDKKITINVLIENDKAFSETYVSNQKLQVIINKTLAKLNITAEGRELKREDGTPLTDLSLTILEAAIRDGETLRFFKKAPKPDRDKGFAFLGSGWHQEPSLANLYKAEMDVLKNGLAGDFQLTSIINPSQTNPRIIALGILNFDNNKKIAVQIVFPTKYPFMQPKLLPLVSDENGEPLQPLTAKHYGKGNQYNDGAMCLQRSDQWSRTEHNIGWCLRRAQYWLQFANSKDGFPADKIVLERPSHFKHAGQVLLPRQLIPPEVNTGELILTQFKPNYYILEQNILPSSPFNLNLGQEIFKWYKFDESVTLKTIFPQANISGESFINLFNQHFAENILEGAPNQNIAFYLPGEENPWHFFKITIKKSGNQAALNIAYYLARTVETELYLRTQDIFNPDILLKKRVTIIGLGAIGSEVARSLARNGVGLFDLFDKDTFEIGNSIRHAADLFFIGEDKVQVAKQLILRSNPNIQVNTFKSDVLDDAGLLEGALSNSDLCIVLTAEEHVDYYINEFYARKFNIPFVFARISAGGLSGAIQITNIKEASCLNCLRLHGVDVLPEPKGGAQYNELPPEYGSCSTPAVPASEIDTKEIALQVTRVGLQLLVASENNTYAKLGGHQMYWHGPFGSKGKQPFTWELKKIQKHENCEICNQRG